LVVNLQQEVAERKEAQHALQQSQELTLRQERLAAVGQLAAGLAHEFNNILTIVQGYATLLLDNPSMDEDAIKSTNHITEGVERTAALVKQMLAFSRKQVMQQRVMHIQETINQIADMLGRLLGKHVELHLDIAPQLPPILADPEMLQQVIANLIVNARDAMSSAGRLTIAASEASFAAADLDGKPDRRAGQFIRLSVSDTGAGMDSAVINHLFEPFFTTKDIGKGCGMGLATVYGMVNQNAGWIEVESTVGQGTTFNIFFPVTEPPGDKTPPKTRKPRARGGRETVLVVEDETVLRELVREILEANGYHVLDAASGREALVVWEKHGKNIDLLLTDMAMPDGLSGRDLASKLHEGNPRLPVIFSSGYSQESLERKEPGAQTETFLSKPYQPADLARVVRNTLDNAANVQAGLASSDP
jgi:nitrogen-specific signal transduction histidine kinase/ActR/RegA family two-component response regulator